MDSLKIVIVSRDQQGAREHTRENYVMGFISLVNSLLHGLCQRSAAQNCLHKIYTSA